MQKKVGDNFYPRISVRCQESVGFLVFFQFQKAKSYIFISLASVVFRVFKEILKEDLSKG